MKKDLINKTFTYLKVIEYSHMKIRKRKGIQYCEKLHYWKCQCKCGNIIVCHGASLISGNTKSCGCLRIKYDIAGQKFGEWTVLKLATPVVRSNGHKERAWLCICSCDKKQILLQGSLIRGRSSRCFECRRSKNKSYGEILYTYWHSLQRGAKKRNIKFEIDIQYCWDLFLKQERKCKLSGVELEFGKQSLYKASLDRINPNMGYIIGNVQWINRTINMCKGNLQNNDLIKICIRTSEWQNKINSLKGNK